MRVERVTYERLVNLGNYENERAQATVILNEGESVSDAFIMAKGEVMESLDLEVKIEKSIVKRK